MLITIFLWYPYFCIPLVTYFIILVTGKTIYAQLQNSDRGLQKKNSFTSKQENSGYLRNSQSSSIGDMSKYSKGHRLENTDGGLSNLPSRLDAATPKENGQPFSEVNDLRFQVQQFSQLFTDRDYESSTSPDYTETDRTNNAIAKDLVNQVNYTSELISTCLGERCEPDGKEEDKKDTKFKEINHETFPMCREITHQVKETEGKPMQKGLCQASVVNNLHNIDINKQSTFLLNCL